ncbi:MAG: trypsin-like peptidase domain-containing protein, partial [Phycisphaerales bacterium]|nr:trypsin-like peptidase domain-containing protein [Phycisphaerales bacterium]
MRRTRLVFLLFCLLGGRWATAEPPARAGSVAALETVEQIVLPKLDLEAIEQQDETLVRLGRVPRFAFAQRTRIDPASHGQWERQSDGTLLWRVRLTSPGALSLSLGFSRYQMPAGGQLLVTSVDRRHRVGPFTERDNKPHDQLWTPPLFTDSVVLEVTVPETQARQLELELTSVNHGYAGFGEKGQRAGGCNFDVACATGAGWSDAARSVALLTIGGVRFCTGFLVNDTAFDGRPYLVTARHCGFSAAEAASVVVIWNHQNTGCTETPPAETATLRHFQTGATLRATHPDSDFALLELDEMPHPSFGSHYAGWDRSTADPERAAVIHHPNTDIKRIAFDFDPAKTTSHLHGASPGDGSHLRVGSWELGTTEGGSSGAPLFNQDRRVVGQLHGGWAACGNGQADWFGRFSAAWTGGGTPATRLSDWLDPLG